MAVDLLLIIITMIFVGGLSFTSILAVTRVDNMKPLTKIGLVTTHLLTTAIIIFSIVKMLFN